MPSFGTTSTARPQGYLPFIDGLRAIAVLSVFLYHLEPSWLPGGFTGVDVFFVISGFVISGSLDNRGLSTFGQFLSYFYSRRIKRIMPALLACVLVTAVVFVLFSIPGSGQPVDIRDTALSSLFGFSNLVLFGSEQDYFAPAAELNPFTHTWSLGVEEQFYLLFPFIFFWWAKDNASTKQRLLSASLIAVGLMASLIVAVFTSSNEDGFGFYMLPARFWELALGVLIYQLHASHFGESVLSNLRFQWLAPVSAILIGAGFVVSEKESFPIPWALFPALGTAGLIACLLQSKTSPLSQPIKRFLASMPMVYIGQRSYSMYLWHWPVLVMFRWTIGLEGPLLKILATAITIALTIVSFRFIERPIRSSAYLHAKSNRVTLTGGLVVTLFLLVTTAAIFKAQNRVSLSTTVQNKLIWYPRSRPVTETQNCESRFITQPFAHSNTKRKYGKFISGCTTAVKRRMFSVGDSHAGHYRPMYRTLSADQPIDVFLFSDGGCRFPESLVFSDQYSSNCNELGRMSKREILRLAKPGDILFLPGKRVRPLHLPPPATNKGVVPLARMQSELQPFLDRGVHVILETAKPVFLARANQCSDWFNRANPVCAKGLSVSKAHILERALRQTSVSIALSNSHPRIHLWQPLSVLCPGETCTSMLEEKPLNFDTNHLSWWANRLLYPKFEAEIESLLGVER